ncbi:MAG: PIN domain-containing protein [Candidatus Latescibacteria bacterium]|nr:PIN domain-containing protein [Candidatus Latescibacterota bacterium]
MHLIVSDPDDNKFVDCAICAGADYIVTKDRHYDKLVQAEVPQITVIHPDILLTMLP